MNCNSDNLRPSREAWKASQKDYMGRSLIYLMWINMTKWDIHSPSINKFMVEKRN